MTSEPITREKEMYRSAGQQAGASSRLDIVWILLSLTCLLFVGPGLSASPASGNTDASPKLINIGVRANRGAAKAIKRWGPTAEFLNQQLPGYHFSLIPFENNSALNQAVSRAEFDFVLTNPASYVEQEIRYGARRIATLINRRNGQGYSEFGSVIFTRSDRSDINNIDDLHGKTFMGADELGFGGWRVAWREMLTQGVDPYHDMKQLMFGGGKQQNVVYAVRDGRADAGSVRTDMLERMAAAGDIRLKEFKVIGGRQTAGFPFLHSSRLYPEWPLAKLAHTDDALAEQVAQVLFSIRADSAAAKAGKYIGWHTPLDYQPVKELLRELGVGPYSSHGPVSLEEVIRLYWYWMTLFTGCIVAATLVIMRMRSLNRHLLGAERDLRDANMALKQMARLDGLTGIGNRHRLDEFLAQEWGQACRQGFAISMIMFDIDHFKQYNDHYGHLAGDDCLRRVATTANDLFRRAGDLTVRYGGEEFLVVLSNCGLEQCTGFAKDLRRSVEQLDIEHLGSVTAPHLTISLGVASCIARPGMRAQELIAAADAALYSAKEKGRNRVEVAAEQPGR